MEEKVFEVEGKFGVILSVFGYIPEEEPKGIIHIIHGMGEHKDRYKNFMKWIVKKGYAVFAHDHRKHGKSVDEEFYKVGEFTEADRFEYLVDDTHYVVRHLKEMCKDKPFILLGHSMGSIILRRYLTKYSANTNAAIIMGTLPIIKNKDTFLLKKIAGAIKFFKGNKISPFLAKKLNDLNIKGIKEPETDFDWLSTDPKQVEKYINDPLCGFPYTPQFYIEFFDMCVKVNESEIISEGRDIPLLFISGKDDPVGGFGDGVREVYELYNAHGYFQLTLKLIPEFRHEVLNETSRTTTYKMIDEWLESVI